MTTNAPELLSAIKAVSRKGTIQNQVDFGQKPLNLKFSGDARNLVAVLADNLEQSEPELVSTLLNHGLSESLKALSELLSNDEFANLKKRLISELGFSVFLDLKPEFTYAQGLSIPNFAEVTVPHKTFLGRWTYSQNQVMIQEIHSPEVIFTFDDTHKPELSVDGVSWQWGEKNIVPFYVEEITPGDFEEDISNANLLVFGENGCFYREDEYLNELTFSSYDNASDMGLVNSKELAEIFEVRINKDKAVLKYKGNAKALIDHENNSGWNIVGTTLKLYKLHNVIIKFDR